MLDINGEVVTFSEYCMHSGGCCGFSGDYTEEYVEQGEWTVDVPEKYKQYEDEINEVVNENVRWGCCGGCL